MLGKYNSLDNIFKKLVIPTLITYESATVRDYNSISENFENALDQEIKKNYTYFVDKIGKIDIIIHLIMVPLYQKSALVEAFDKELGKLR